MCAQRRQTVRNGVCETHKCHFAHFHFSTRKNTPNGLWKNTNRPVLAVRVTLKEHAEHCGTNGGHAEQRLRDAKMTYRHRTFRNLKIHLPNYAEERKPTGATSHHREKNIPPSCMQCPVRMALAIAFESLAHTTYHNHHHHHHHAGSSLVARVLAASVAACAYALTHAVS